MRTVVEEGGKAHAKSFHDDVRLLVRMLRHLADFLIESGKEEDCSLMLGSCTFVTFLFFSNASLALLFLA